MIVEYSKAKEREICKLAAKVLTEGKLIVYPTDTVYGIGADATSHSAVKVVYELKQRPDDQPLSVLIADKKMLKEYAKTVEIEKGPYTFIIPSKPMPVAKGNIGFRFPDHWCVKIAKAFGKPITATSANIHRQPTPATVKELERMFKDRVALYIDAGSLTGRPSKVIDLSTGRTLRE